jgi:hypothetical protein
MARERLGRRGVVATAVALVVVLMVAVIGAVDSFGASSPSAQSETPSRSWRTLAPIGALLGRPRHARRGPGRNDGAAVGLS